MSIFQKSNNRQSSRRQINIKGVSNGVLMLPGNEFRVVLSTSSINFELRSEDEQDVILETFQSFLNALPCPMQILFRVREMDMDNYLEFFNEKLKKETKEIYQIQINNYCEFVKGLISTNKILSRSFYIVLPYSSPEPVELEVAQEQLKLNTDIVSRGLGRLGMRTRKLSSLEILDLFYNFYNPEQAKLQPVTSRTLQLLKEAYI